MPRPDKSLDLDTLSDDALLQARLCDLNIEIKGSWVEERVHTLYAELEKHGLRLKPTCYIGDEWFTPVGVSAIALPFYLFHPRLLALEKKMMLDAEGGVPDECLRLLRHECGHSVIHAFHLTRRAAWIKLFGSPNDEGRDFYHFRPYSKSYVRHLKGWYAQSDPEEDFAETFAVWLDPESDWKRRYADWPAIKKLEYIDALMPELKEHVKPPKRADLTYHISSLKRRLVTHYQQRRRFYAEEGEDYYDADLKTIFPAQPKGLRAAAWIRRSGRVLDKAVSQWTHEPRFTVRRLRGRLATRASILGLGLPKDKDADGIKLAFTAYLASLISNYVFTSHFKRRP